MADCWAKEAAESIADAVERGFRQGTSFAHLTRPGAPRTASQNTSTAEGATNTREAASPGEASDTNAEPWRVTITNAYPGVRRQEPSYVTGYRNFRRISAGGVGARRNRPASTSLSDVYKAWPLQREELWKNVGHHRAPTARMVFNEGKTAPAVLAFLRETQVGQFVTLSTLGGAAEEEGS